MALTMQEILASRPNIWVSITDFGATGDGVTDDTAAIQAALDTGKNVYIPPAKNEYLVTAQLVPHAGQVIQGGGKFSAATGFHGIVAAMNVSIFKLGDGVDTSKRFMAFQNLTARNMIGAVIDSNYSTDWNAFNCAFISYGESYNTIVTKQSYRIAFNNSFIGKSKAGYALYLMDNSNVIGFYSCTITGGTAGGVGDIGSSYNITLQACVFEVSLIGLRFGTNLTDPGGGECNGINIIGCSWEQYGIALQIGNGYACRGVNVAGNFFSNTGTSGGITKNTSIIIGRVSGLNMYSNRFTPAATEYLFDFWHVADLNAVLPCVSASRIHSNEFSSVGLGYKLSGHFVTYPSLGNRIAKGLYMEFGVSDKDNHYSIIGDKQVWNSGAISPGLFTNLNVVTSTGATGAYIEKVEILSVDPSSNLAGTLNIGYSGNVTYNLNLNLASVSWTTVGYGKYADITNLLTTKFVAVSDKLLTRVVSAAGTGTLQVIITYRK